MIVHFSTEPIDEPEDAGGTNDGPNPAEYLLAVLSGRLNIVGHIVAQELGFILHGLDIDIVMSRCPISDNITNATPVKIALA